MNTKRNRKKAERRRIRAGKMLAEGVSQAEVAKRVGVSRQSVLRWARALEVGGIDALRSHGQTGPKPALSDADCQRLATSLKEGPSAHGFVTELWTAKRVALLIKREFGATLSEAQAWRVLRERLGWSVQRPARRAREQDAQAVAHWKRYTWPRLRRKAIEEGRTIVFVDESGLSQRPTRSRTWAPKGQTPVLEFSFNWRNLSAIAGVTFYRFYFRMFDGSIKSPQVVEFLKHLQRQIDKRLLVIWDGLQAHRSRLVREHIESTNGHVHLARLPAYAPELNPVEFLWGHWKKHEVANLCADSIHQLSHHARNALKRMQRRPTLLRAFWIQADMSL